MNLSSALELKQKILEAPRYHAEQRASQAQALFVEPDRERRLAVGYSQTRRREFRVEIRVEKGDGAAHSDAEGLQRRYGAQEINVEVVPVVEVPSVPQLKQSPTGKASLTREARPLTLGLSIGLVGGGAGTLGAFVRYRKPVPGAGAKKRTAEQDAILSNNHVLALADRAAFGDLVYQPGYPHQKPILGPTQIAKLSSSVPLARNAANESDAAIADLLAGVSYEGNVIPSRFPHRGKRLQGEQDWGVLRPDQVVCKVGCRTGFTRGRVSAVALDGVTVSVGRNYLAVFDNLLEVRWESNRKPFTKPGDSGSLVFTEEDLVPVGLHFAGGRIQKDGRTWIGLSYACNLKTVLRAFKARLT